MYSDHGLYLEMEVEWVIYHWQCEYTLTRVGTCSSHNFIHFLHLHCCTEQNLSPSDVPHSQAPSQHYVAYCTQNRDGAWKISSCTVLCGVLDNGIITRTCCLYKFNSAEDQVALLTKLPSWLSHCWIYQCGSKESLKGRNEQLSLENKYCNMNTVAS